MIHDIARAEEDGRGAAGAKKEYALLHNSLLFFLIFRAAARS